MKPSAANVLAEVRKNVGADYPLIGVGGVFTGEDVRDKMAAGANLVQIYTSFIYEGPMIAKRLGSVGLVPASQFEGSTGRPDAVGQDARRVAGGTPAPRRDA